MIQKYICLSCRAEKDVEMDKENNKIPNHLPDTICINCDEFMEKKI